MNSFKVGSACILLGLLLTACGPSAEDAKKLGFQDTAEMKLAEKAGFKNADDFAKSKGFLNKEEMRKAEPDKTAEEYAKRLGFNNVAEFRNIQGKGFPDLLAYAKSKGFSDTDTFRKAGALGIENSQDYDKYLVKKRQEEELAAKRAADPYFDYPEDQREFIKIVTNAQQQSKSAANDMQRGGAKSQRDSALCALLSSTRVQGWRGTLAKISSNSDGFGVLAVKIAPDVTVKTWNNSFSDSRSGTLIPPGTPLFNKASGMSVGQSVKFSGNFFSGDSGDCIREGSLSLRGKLEDPDFIFRFENLIEN